MTISDILFAIRSINHKSPRKIFFFYKISYTIITIKNLHLSINKGKNRIQKDKKFFKPKYVQFCLKSKRHSHGTLFE